MGRGEGGQWMRFALRADKVKGSWVTPFVRTGGRCEGARTKQCGAACLSLGAVGHASQPRYTVHMVSFQSPCHCCSTVAFRIYLAYSILHRCLLVAETLTL
ncbi:unnamed protein product [Ectocarpus sp. 12 AP-2014]